MIRFFQKRNKKYQKLVEEIVTLGRVIDSLSERVESLEKSRKVEDEEDGTTFEEIRNDWLKGAEEDE